MRKPNPTLTMLLTAVWRVSNWSRAGTRPKHRHDTQQKVELTAWVRVVPHVLAEGYLVNLLTAFESLYGYNISRSERPPQSYFEFLVEMHQGNAAL